MFCNTIKDFSYIKACLMVYMSLMLIGNKCIHALDRQTYSLFSWNIRDICRTVVLGVLLSFILFQANIILKICTRIFTRYFLFYHSMSFDFEQNLYNKMFARITTSKCWSVQNFIWRLVLFTGKIYSSIVWKIQ